ncbi:hypothetical protein PAXRUDRAFT_167694 [Paxillus rubicundulus Ve08.2h10]|uniref:Reverse transcriptase zinc-binding domain-containing protein n=1 Tax=Paxillus rubicundulus Ve08.2h10 TaxID=930991 RepID=A0A0D0CPC2_9AGAM|nr:hypothetical protein PAXRUDRAFT_167694 [Paxillus rubicundulus Ve08.2h10]
MGGKADLVWRGLRRSRVDLHNMGYVTKSDTPDCPHCPGVNEDMIYFLLSCPHYAREHHQFLSQLRQRTTRIHFLPLSSKGAHLVLNYIYRTGCFKPTFGDVHVNN